MLFKMLTPMYLHMQLTSPDVSEKNMLPFYGIVGCG